MNQDVPYRFSKFCKVFQKGNIRALYHSLNMELIYIPRVMEKLLEVFNTGCTLKKYFDVYFQPLTFSEKMNQLIEVLIEKEMLIPSNIDELETMRKIQNSLGRPEIEVMYLVLTDQCNMKCSYCFLETEAPAGYNPSDMSIETTKRAIDLFTRFLSSSPKRKYIQLYGGEPLLNVKTLRYAVSYINHLKREGKLPKNVYIALVTNGTLLNKEIILFLKENDVSVGVSIDGDKNVMDAHRRYKSGKSLHRKIIENYQLLKQLGVQSGVSCTLTPENLDNFDLVLEYLINLDVRAGLSFNILLCNAGIPVTEEYVIKASECVLKGFERFREMGIYEETMMRKVKSFVNKEIALTNCAGYGHQLVIYPQGKIGVCQDDVKSKKYVAGSVYDENFSPWENELIKEWSKRSPVNMPQCFDCEAIGICGGGCAANAAVEYGSIWNIDKRFCVHCKKSLEWLIWDQYSQIQKK